MDSDDSDYSNGMTQHTLQIHMSKTTISELNRRLTILEHNADALDMVFDQSDDEYSEEQIVDIRERLERLIEYLDTVQDRLDQLL